MVIIITRGSLSMLIDRKPRCNHLLTTATATATAAVSVSSSYCHVHDKHAMISHSDSLCSLSIAFPFNRLRFRRRAIRRVVMMVLPHHLSSLTTRQAIDSLTDVTDRLADVVLFCQAYFSFVIPWSGGTTIFFSSLFLL